MSVRFSRAVIIDVDAKSVETADLNCMLAFLTRIIGKLATTNACRAEFNLREFTQTRNLDVQELLVRRDTPIGRLPAVWRAEFVSHRRSITATVTLEKTD